MHETPRLKLPYIVAGQAQKEVAHNEALAILDSLCAPVVEQEPLDTPPATPHVGAAYIIGQAPTGAWTGNGGKLAIYSSGGWRFVDPPSGTRMVIATSGLIAEFRSGAWELGIVRAEAVKIRGLQVLSSQEAAIAQPSGGSTVDSEVRTAVAQILAALRHHGLIAT